MECDVWNVKCTLLSVKWGDGRLQFGLSMWSAECKAYSVECGVPKVESKSVKCGV